MSSALYSIGYSILQLHLWIEHGNTTRIKGDIVNACTITIKTKEIRFLIYVDNTEISQYNINSKEQNDKKYEYTVSISTGFICY